MRQRTRGVAMVVAACLALAGCAADDEVPVHAEGTSETATAQPSPTSPTAGPEAPTESPPDVPSPSPDDPVVAPPAGPAATAPPEDSARPPGRQPLPEPSDPAPTAPTPSSPSPGPSQPSTAPKPPPAPEEVGGPSGVLAFGQTYVWDNGLAVTVGRPREHETTEEGDSREDSGPSGTAPSGQAGSSGTTAPSEETNPSESAEASGADVDPVAARPAATAPADTSRVLVVDLVVVNGTDEPVNTSIFVAMTSGGADAPAVYDPGAGLTGPPGTIIQPGKSARFTMGFEAKDPADLTMEVRPAYRYVSALFVRPVGAQG